MFRRPFRRCLTALLLPVLILTYLSPPALADSEGAGPETYWGLADAITDADVVTVDGKPYTIATLSRPVGPPELIASFPNARTVFLDAVGTPVGDEGFARRIGVIYQARRLAEGSIGSPAALRTRVELLQKRMQLHERLQNYFLALDLLSKATAYSIRAYLTGGTSLFTDLTFDSAEGMMTVLKAQANGSAQATLDFIDAEKAYLRAIRLAERGIKDDQTASDYLLAQAEAAVNETPAWELLDNADKLDKTTATLVANQIAKIGKDVALKQVGTAFEIQKGTALFDELLDLADAVGDSLWFQEYRAHRDKVWRSRYLVMMPGTDVYQEPFWVRYTLQLAWLGGQNATKAPVKAGPKPAARPATGSSGVRVIVNGEALQADVAPQVKDGRTLVPLRAVAEALGAQVLWDDQTKTATFLLQNRTVRLQLNSHDAVVNGETSVLSQPVQVVDDRVMVPVRFVSEALGAEVVWNDRTQTVAVQRHPTKADAIEPPPAVTGLSLSQGSALGGDTVMIEGSGFTASTRVAFGSQEATSVEWITPNLMRVKSPPGIGTVDVTVTNEAGSSAAGVSIARFKYLVLESRTVPVLTATSRCYNGWAGLQLSWTPVQGATHYVIFRGDLGLQREDGSVTTAWIGAPENVQYAWSVQAMAGASATARSLPVVAVAQPCQALSAPTVTAVTSKCDLTQPGLEVTWTAVPGARRYEIYRDDQLLYTTRTDGTSFWNTGGVEAGRTHTYKVRALGDGLPGPLSASVSGTASACGTQTAQVPRLLSAEPVCDVKTPGIQLTWEQVSGATAYEIFRDGLHIFTTQTAGTTFWNVTGLTPGLSYTYRVRAVGGTEFSNALLASAPACGGAGTVAPPNNPGGTTTGGAAATVAPRLAALATPTLTGAQPECDGSTTGIRLSWNPVNGASHYQIYRDGALIFTTKTAGTTFWNVTGLTPGQSYSYQVQAVGGGTASALSGGLSATAPACGGSAPTPQPAPQPAPQPTPQPPQQSAPTLSPPALYSATPECDGATPGIRLLWGAVSGATSYQIYRNGSLIYTTQTAGTSFWNVTGLSAGQSYTYQVQALGSGGSSNLSSALAATAPSCGTPAPQPTPQPTPQPGTSLATPTMQSASPACDGSTPGIQIQWSSVSGATSYNIYRNGSLIFTTQTAGTTFWNVTGLSAGQSYSYQVQALGGGNSSSLSGGLSATAPSCGGSSPTPQPTPQPQPTPSLGTPSMLSASPECDGSAPGIRLSWSSVSGATNYNIYRNGSLIYTTQTAGTTFWNVTGLSAGQSYSYQVQAVGSGMTSSLSGGLSATAPSCGGSSGSGIQVGATVRTTANLRLRACAGTSDSACPSLVTMPAGTVMSVIGGPTSADGYTWWRLSGTVSGSSYSGWAVQDYLTR